MILERYAIFDRKWEKSLTESLLPFARAVPINQGRNLSALNRAGTFWGQSRVCRDQHQHVLGHERVSGAQNVSKKVNKHL